MKLTKLILYLCLCNFVNDMNAQHISAEILSKKDSVSIGESIIIKWNVENADKIHITPFGTVDNSGERKIKIESDYTFMIIAENNSEQKIIKKTIWLKTKTKGTRHENEEEYIHPVRGKLKGKSLIDFSEILEEILQNKMRFSLSVINSTDNNIILKTNLADRTYLLTDDDEDNKINKRRISYLISFELDKETKGQIRYVIKALIEKKKIIKKEYTKETNEDIYHFEIEKLKKIIESK